MHNLILKAGIAVVTVLMGGCNALISGVVKKYPDTFYGCRVALGFFSKLSDKPVEKFSCIHEETLRTIESTAGKKYLIRVTIRENDTEKETKGLVGFLYSSDGHLGFSPDSVSFTTVTTMANLERLVEAIPDAPNFSDDCCKADGTK